MIKLIKGVSGYRPDGSSFRYGAGTIATDTIEIERDLVKAGLAVYEDKQTTRPIAEPPNVTPLINRDLVVNAVIKRGRKPKRNV